jgi:hypothetical protein
MADKVVKAIDESKAVSQVTGDENVFITASVSRTKYEIRPCSFRKVPEVAKRVQSIEDAVKLGAEQGKTELQLLTEENSPFLDAMANLMILGLEKSHPDITIDTIKDEFAPIDFPIVYKRILDINDFLSRMQSIQK